MEVLLSLSSLLSKELFELFFVTRKMVPHHCSWCVPPSTLMNFITLGHLAQVTFPLQSCSQHHDDKVSHALLCASVPTLTYEKAVFWLFAHVKTSISREGIPSNQKRCH